MFVNVKLGIQQQQQQQQQQQLRDLSPRAN
jgi:hypothetical protein